MAADNIAIRRTQGEVQSLLDRHNPGETLSWPMPALPVEVPDHCLRTMESGGAALLAFFAAANRIFYEHRWVRALVEKRFHPNYRRLNDAQPDALPVNPRPDIVPDEDWNPRFVELELTVGGRSDAALMGEAWGLPRATRSVELYAQMLDERNVKGRPHVLLSAFHPAYAPLVDDAACFASLLREAGAAVEAISDDDLPFLRYERGVIRCLRPGRRFEFATFDRLIDIFEVAELAHPGMRAILDAYLDGQATDVNTCKQFLDEKIWLALFFDPRLESVWRAQLSEEHHLWLRNAVPFTTLVHADSVVPVGDEMVPILRLHELSSQERRFVTKESGTSETAAAAQSFVTLHELSRRQVRRHIRELVYGGGPPTVIQELIESAKISFDARDPAGKIFRRSGARVKMSAHYINGVLGDILFVASNAAYAVHDADFMEAVVRRPQIRRAPRSASGPRGAGSDQAAWPRSGGPAPGRRDVPWPASRP